MSSPDGARPLPNHLQLFRPAPGDEVVSGPGGLKLSDDLTLCEFWSVWFKPMRRRRSNDDTVKADRNALAHWRRHTGDPTLKQIDDRTLITFVDGLEAFRYPRGTRKGQPMAIATRRKLIVAVDTILAAAGPKRSDRRRRRFASVVKDPPAFAVEDIPQAVAAPVEHAYSVEHIEMLLAVCHEQRVPTFDGNLGRISPQIWWTSLVLLLWYTGLRISELMLWRWTWHTDRDLTVPSALLPGGGVHPEASDARGFELKRKRSLTVPLSDEVRQILETLDGPGRTEFVLPWHCRIHSLLYQYKRLARRAGVPLHKGEVFRLFRKGHAQAMPAEHDIVQQSLGHAEGSDVTDAHYMGHGGGLGHRLAMEAMPKPKRPPLRPRERQRELFD